MEFPTRSRALSEELVRGAEEAKTHMFDVKDKKTSITQIEQTSVVNNDYLVVAAHVGKVNLCKIANNEHVDFGKLLSKDRVITEHHNRMEMVNWGGLTYWIPLSDKGTTQINSFNCWEQAFRVFANIYTKSSTHHMFELIESNHVIYLATQKYPWENVAMNDRF